MDKKVVFVILIVCCLSCRNNKNNDSDSLAWKANVPFAIDGLNETKRGDIIIRPNVNFLPGSACIPNGANFGHAAIVTKGFKHNNIDTLLMNTLIIESMAANVPQAFQVREGYALNTAENLIERCVSFSQKFEGNRYLVRPYLSESQVDSVVAFALNQKGDVSNWNAIKRFEGYVENADSNKVCWADNDHWYCSLLVWQSFLYVTGVDFDLNGGFYVYPNDLLLNPLFDNTNDLQRRFRF